MSEQLEAATVTATLILNDINRISDAAGVNVAYVITHMHHQISLRLMENGFDLVVLAGQIMAERREEFFGGDEQT